MAVEYEISSDVATIKDVAPNTQVARVVSLYSGQITYDDEAGSKFATATINGKSQRVMLCIAVNGTVNYDDVPSLYSTVDGHRCLNIVAPTETGTPDDVPSVYETVVIDGKNVRAVRCILINATPIYDGVSSTCTFVENGKTHTAQLVNKITGGAIEIIVKGISPISLPDAIANSLEYLKAFGGTEQRNIPAEYTQVNYVTNTASTAVDTGIMIDFAKNYEFEVECRAVSGSWYILQSRASSSGNITGIHGATSGSTITLVVGNVTICTSAITRTVGNKLYVKATLNAGTATLYVKDETAGTEDTQTGSYGTSQPNPTASVYLLGNAGGQYADVNSDIYMARIKENDTVVMDYVPARQVATAGFYDTVSGTFKTALTPANLSADGNTVPSPETPMDIVSNNGALKYGQYGKNLFDKDGTYTHGWYVSNNTIADSPTVNRTVAIRCLPNTTYYIKHCSVKGGARLFYTEVEDWDVGSPCSAAVGTIAADPNVVYSITTSANAKWIFAQYGRGGDITATFEEQAADFILSTEVLTSDTPYEAYHFGIHTDGTVETIRVHGKNLYNSATSEEGKYLTDTGEVALDANAMLSDYIAVLPNTTYTYVGTRIVTGIFTRIESFDANKSFVSLLVRDGNIGTLTKSFNTGNAKYIRMSFQKAMANVQIELGSTATTYEPYYDGGTATAEMLLKVGTYQDVQEILSGAVTRNVGVKVFDGTENWFAYGGGAGYQTTVQDMLSSTSGAYFCTHAIAVSSITSKGIRFGAGNKILYWCQINTTFTTLDIFKAWLADQYNAGTPVIIVYPLATPTTEPVTGQPMQVQQGDNFVEITQASLDNLELEAKYQAAVSLTIQEVQDANLDPNVQVTIN